jgi:hypothetical protein
VPPPRQSQLPLATTIGSATTTEGRREASSRGASRRHLGCQASTVPGTSSGLHHVDGDDEEARRRPWVAPRCAPPPQDLARRRRILRRHRILCRREEEEGAVAPSEGLTTGRGCAVLDGVGHREPSAVAGAPTSGRCRSHRI